MKIYLILDFICTFSMIVRSRGGINSFGRVVANWSSLSDNQAIALRNALQIIYNDGCGQEVIDNLLSNGLSFNIDFSYSSEEIMNHWKDHCKNSIDFPIVGMSSFHWNDDCYTINPSTSCDNPHFISGNIYLAMDLLGTKVIKNNEFQYYDPNKGFFESHYPIEQKSLLMILAHEIKHAFDSYNCHGPIDKEKSANRFMIDIWNRTYAPCVYNEGRWY